MYDSSARMEPLLALDIHLRREAPTIYDRASVAGLHRDLIHIAAT